MHACMHAHIHAHTHNFIHCQSNISTQTISAITTYTLHTGNHKFLGLCRVKCRHKPTHKNFTSSTGYRAEWSADTSQHTKNSPVQQAIILTLFVQCHPRTGFLTLQCWCSHHTNHPSSPVSLLQTLYLAVGLHGRCAFNDEFFKDPGSWIVHLQCWISDRFKFMDGTPSMMNLWRIQVQDSGSRLVCLQCRIFFIILSVFCIMGAMGLMNAVMTNMNSLSMVEQK